MLLQTYYDDFVAVAPPYGSGALCAWIGTISPFQSATDRFAAIADLEHDRQVNLGLRGAIIHFSTCGAQHITTVPADVIAAARGTFKVMVLEFARPKNPQVFCIYPKISRRIFPDLPHLRDDQMIYLDEPLQALCLYLASDGVFHWSDEWLLTILDFTSIWLAKFVIWKATRKMYCRPIGLSFARTTGDSLGLAIQSRQSYSNFFRTDIATLSPDEIFINAVNGHVNHFSQGNWIGAEAPHYFHQLYSTIKASQECPCGQGLRYGQCCRPIHQTALRNAGISI